MLSAVRTAQRFCHRSLPAIFFWTTQLQIYFFAAGFFTAFIAPALGRAFPLAFGSTSPRVSSIGLFQSFSSMWWARWTKQKPHSLHRLSCSYFRSQAMTTSCKKSKVLLPRNFNDVRCCPVNAIDTWTCLSAMSIWSTFTFGHTSGIRTSQHGAPSCLLPWTKDL